MAALSNHQGPQYRGDAEYLAQVTDEEATNFAKEFALRTEERINADWIERGRPDLRKVFYGLLLVFNELTQSQFR